MLFAEACSAAVFGPGIFYSSGSGWVKLLEAASPTLGTQGFAAFLLDPVNNANVNYAFAGADATVQLTERRPAFHVIQVLCRIAV